MFMDGLECGCLGMMTFNCNSKENTFTIAGEVLDFFNSKLNSAILKKTS